MKRLLGILALSLCTSCAFSDQPLALAEYEASLPERHAPGLAGRKVCIESVEYAPGEQRGWSGGEPDATPDGYEYRGFSDAAERQWAEHLKAQQDAAGEPLVIGYVRNGFGMTTADVVTRDDPAAWFAEMLRLEIVGQGGEVVASREAADVTVRAVVRHVDVDLYMTTKSHLVVDIELVSGSATRTLSLHGYGTKTAWWGTALEYYGAIRNAAQQLLWRLLPELAVEAAA